jgi:hypothetical protein
MLILHKLLCFGCNKYHVTTQGVKNMKKTRSSLAAAALIGGMGLVFVSPIAVSAATDSENTTINASVDSTITLTQSTSTVNLALSPTSGAVESQGHVSLTVDTNNATGYTLTINDQDTDNTLNQTSPAASFAASSGTATTPVALVANTWGYHIDSWASSGTGADATSTAPTTVKFAAVPLSSGTADTLATTSAPGSGSKDVYFGAQADATQTSGTGYTDTVVFTATTN